MDDYLMYYGMSANPFDKTTKTVIETIDFKELSFRLKYLINTLGIGLVTGRPGVGKTIILRKFTENLDLNQYHVSYMPLSTITVGDFYNQVANSIGVDPSYRKSIKFRQIQERITEMHDIEHITPVFIIDEAQYLNGEIFNELMLITNFGMDAEKKCVVILSGLPTLAQKLQRPQFEAFRQRITVSYQVVGMEPEEAHIYVKNKLKSVGVESDILTEEALANIIKNSGGSIRRLDLIITECLILGAKINQKIINHETVYAANEELSLI